MAQVKGYVCNTTVDEKSSRLMEQMKKWAAWYRLHPDKFVEEYLQLNLFFFQKIMICVMMMSTNLVFCAARGLGKTYLTALYCVVRCILFPGTKICVCSKSLKQAKGVLLKIEQELMPESAALRSEIKNIRINNTEGVISFHNKSFIFTSVASDNARGYRCNILIVDEYRLVDPLIVSLVLKKFLNVKRMPGFLKNDKYKNDPKYEERNSEIYMSSCWLKSSWGWQLPQDYAVNMMNDNKKYFVCGLPYQLAIKEGLLMRSQVEDEMSEGSFNSILFSMEMECLWYGEAIDSFFKYEDLMNARKYDLPLYTNDVLALAGKAVSNPKKGKDEVRMISVDVALMSSKKNRNDATSIYVWRLIPNKTGQYARKIAYAETMEGKHSEEQAIKIRQLFEDFECDYIVIDRVGVSMAVLENLIKDLVNPTTGETYEGLSCMNDSEIASRYRGSAYSPRKCIYAINGSSTNNNMYAIKFRDALMRGKIQFPITEQQFNDDMSKNKEFLDLPENIKFMIRMPYIQTTLTVNEILNLKCESKNNLIVIKESSTNRKDRYSSLSYGNAFVDYLEDKKKHRHANNTKGYLLKYREPAFMRQR